MTDATMTTIDVAALNVLADWFDKLPDGGMGKEHFDGLVIVVSELLSRAAVPSEQEPVAWRAPVNPYGQPGFEYAEAEQALIDKGRHERQPLFAHPAPAAGVKVKPPKWKYFHAIGADTPEEWFASTPEGQSLTVTYDESCELPWVARPFPPGPSNYATADEAKAALEAAREARILSALDTGEPK